MLPRPDRLAAALADLFDDPDAAAARTRLARARALSHYGAAAMQRELGKLILQVSARP